MERRLCNYGKFAVNLRSPTVDANGAPQWKIHWFVPVYMCRFWLKGGSKCLNEIWSSERGPREKESWRGLKWAKLEGELSGI